MAAYDAASLTTVVGGPESMLSLAAAGQLPAAPTVLAGDRPDGLPAGPVTLTDGLRRREVAFGLLHDNASATMTAEEEGWLGRAGPGLSAGLGRRATAPRRVTSASRGHPASSSWSAGAADWAAAGPSPPAVRRDRRRPEHLLALRARDRRRGQWLELELTDRGTHPTRCGHLRPGNRLHARPRSP